MVSRLSTRSHGVHGELVCTRTRRTAPQVTSTLVPLRMHIVPGRPRQNKDTATCTCAAWLRLRRDIYGAGAARPRQSRTHYASSMHLLRAAKGNMGVVDLGGGLYNEGVGARRGRWVIPPRVARPLGGCCWCCRWYRSERVLDRAGVRVCLFDERERDTHTHTHTHTRSSVDHDL